MRSSGQILAKKVCHDRYGGLARIQHGKAGRKEMRHALPNMDVDLATRRMAKVEAWRLNHAGPIEWSAWVECQTDPYIAAQASPRPASKCTNSLHPKRRSLLITNRWHQVRLTERTLSLFLGVTFSDYSNPNSLRWVRAQVWMM
jgi:hypothetical protein